MNEYNLILADNGVGSNVNASPRPSQNQPEFRQPGNEVPREPNDIIGRLESGLFVDLLKITSYIIAQRHSRVNIRANDIAVFKNLMPDQICAPNVFALVVK